jgi:hypothetical protein
VRPRPAVLLLLLAVVLGPVAVATLARRPAARPSRACGPVVEAAAPVPAGGGYFPVGPVTVAEPALGPHGSVTLALTGVGGVPPGGVEAVALSLAAVPAAGGALALAAGDLPPGADDPVVALDAGRPAAASLVVAVPSDGRVRLANRAPGATGVTVVVDGYFAAPCGGGGAGFVPAPPDRSAPWTATLDPGQAATFPPGGAAGPPGGGGGGPPGGGSPGGAPGAVAVAVQVAAGPRAAAGALRVGPDEPGAAGGPAAGLRIVPLGPSGRVRVANTGDGRATVTLRPRGWYRRGAGTSYRTAGPEPLLDTTVPAGGTAGFAAAGAAGVPAAGVGAVALEVRAVAQAAGTLELAGAPVAALGPGRAAGGFDLVPPGAGEERLAVRNASAGPVRVTVRARGYHGAPAPLRAAPDPVTAAAFDRSGVAAPGWTGGDGNVPVRLPDGRTAWLFGDSFVGTVRPDGSRATSALVRNALVVQDGQRLQTRVGPPDPAGGQPTALLAAPDPAGGAGTWLWPGTGLVEGGTLQAFLQEFRRPAGASDPAAFEWTGRNLLATLSLPDLAPQGVTPVYGGAPAAGGVGWGTAVLQEADFTYLYGEEDTGPPLHTKHVHLARFPRGGARGSWAFWDGAGWSPDPARSARLLGAPAGSGGRLEPLTGTPSGVVPAGAGYLELTIPDGAHQVAARLACSPTGPWGPPRVLYQVPEQQAYLARAYPDGPGLLLAYSHASLDRRELLQRAGAYRPRFVRVR